MLGLLKCSRTREDKPITPYNVCLVLAERTMAAETSSRRKATLVTRKIRKDLVSQAVKQLSRNEQQRICLLPVCNTMVTKVSWFLLDILWNTDQMAILTYHDTRVDWKLMFCALFCVCPRKKDFLSCTFCTSQNIIWLFYTRQNPKTRGITTFGHYQLHWAVYSLQHIPLWTPKGPPWLTLACVWATQMWGMWDNVRCKSETSQPSANVITFTVECCCFLSISIFYLKGMQCWFLHLYILLHSISLQFLTWFPLGQYIKLFSESSS